MPAPKAGNTVRASNYPKTRVVVKAANQTVTNSTTVVNDNDFSVALEANKTYLIEAYLAVGGPAAADVKTVWAISGGVSVTTTTRSCVGPAVATTDASNGSMRASKANYNTQVPYGTDGTLQSSIVESMIVDTTTLGAAGTLTLQWAQNTANVTATTMAAGSYLVITEIDLI